MSKELISSNPLDSVPDSWTGEDLLRWFKFEDSISPPIRKLLPYEDSNSPLVWEGLQSYEDLMFVYINKDLWGFDYA